MSLRLGFDMDGVVADLNAALVREAMRLFPGVELRTDSAASVAPPAPDPDATEVDPSELTPASLPLSRRQERQLWDEVRQIEGGNLDRDDNPLKNAPHTAAAIAADEWTHPYTRRLAAYPLDRHPVVMDWFARVEMRPAWQEVARLWAQPPQWRIMEMDAFRPAAT